MQANLYLRNGLVVTEAGAFHGGVLVTDGVITGLVAGDPDVAADRTLDLEGKWLLPGLVDGHVHFNEPGREHWERCRTGTMAAAAGGVTTILDMPLNSTPPTIHRGELARKRAAVRDQAVVDYGHWGGLVDNNLEELEGLQEGGVIGFKAFMTHSPDYPRVDDDLIFEGMRRIQALGNLLAIHSENEYVTAHLTRKLRDAGRRDLAAWTESRPPFTELEAIQRGLFWAGVTGAHLHIVHVSIPEGLRAAARAKRQGVNVTVETCPHYLMLDTDDFARIGPRAKCAPPIRGQDQVEGLWTCLREGLVDTIGSDHSPCTAAEKEVGHNDIFDAWGGISGIQTMLPGLLTEGVQRRGLSLTRLTRLVSANPARIFGLYPRKGTIRPGSDADLTVVDPEADWTLADADLFYLNPHSAFTGYRFRGRVERTFVRGVCVYDGEKIAVEPGFGQLVARSARMDRYAHDGAQ